MSGGDRPRRGRVEVDVRLSVRFLRLDVTAQRSGRDERKGREAGEGDKLKVDADGQRISSGSPVSGRQDG